MTQTSEVDDLTLLLVDGDNLLHAVRGGRDGGGVAWLLPRLSRWRPPSLRIVVALDGHPAAGDSARRRAAAGIEFHHAGSRSADDLIIDLLVRQPFSGRAHSVVVTRDRGLAERARRNGGLTRSIEWLVARLEDPAASLRRGGTGGAAMGIGRGRVPRPPIGASAGEEEREPWQPGRGATRKRGNPRRGAKTTGRR